MSEIQFQNPQMFWALLVIPLFVFWSMRENLARNRALEKWISKSLWNAMMPDRDPSADHKRRIYWLLGCFFLILAWARPQWGRHEQMLKVTGLDLVFVLDVSSSMDTEDVAPSRLKQAKFFIRNVVESMGGDRIGIVPFAASSYLATPLTSDQGYVLDVLSMVDTQSISHQGTNIGLGLETALQALERGGDSSRVVILVTDGEDFEAQIPKGASRLKDADAVFYALGVGTAEGAPVPVRDQDGNLRGYKKDTNGKPVVSRFRSDALEKLAKSVDGKYFALGVDGRGGQEVLGELKSLKRGQVGDKLVVSYQDRYQWFLLLAILFFMIELGIPRRRKLQPLAAVFLLIFGAENGFSKEPGVGVYLENRKGLKAYEARKIEEARKHFENAQSHDPENSELQYNQGTIDLEEKNLEKAEGAFLDSIKRSELEKDWDLSARGYYNLADTQQKAGKSEEALRSFLRAIESAQRARNAELETDARKRLNQLAQQEKQKQEQKKQKDKDQDKEKEGQGDSKDQEQPSEDENKDQAKKFQEPEKKKDKEFRGKNLKKEDADRVMSELTSREQEVMNRLKRQKKTREVPQSQDW